MATQKFEEVSKFAGRIRSARKRVSSPHNDPDDAFYACMRAEALGAYPFSTESAAIANYITTLGKKLQAWIGTQRMTEE